ncbi:NADP-dependent oxidoreductase [Amycolatopsis magusensis]|uniref:NADP-dependent oxidoreductase n=1 Tax=Amycolatopsis magusensis TaxID=882444 RepID=UPI0037A4DB2B
MPQAVRFTEHGGVEVLRVAEVERPVAGPGQVLVRVKAAGINPIESASRAGRMEWKWPTTFPAGQGSDLAGVVEALGEGVEGFRPGDEVLGFSRVRGTHAEFALAESGDLVPKPAGVPWEQAGALYIVGTAAYAAVRAVALEPGETVAVSGAAGGVGSIAVQLAKRAGASVIGLASPANHGWLTARGVRPVAYGEGAADRIGPVDAFIDTFGAGYVELAIGLGVRPERVNTIIDFEAASRHGTRAEGNEDAATPVVLAELAALIERGELSIPIAGTYPLVEVGLAFAELEKRHTHGKIVLTLP